MIPTNRKLLLDDVNEKKALGHGKGHMYIGVVLLVLCTLLLAIVFLVNSCGSRSQLIDYSQADSFYISNDPPDYYDKDTTDDSAYEGEARPPVSSTHFQSHQHYFV